MNFVQNLEMTHIAGDGGGGAHVICVIMMHCVWKPICDLYLNTFVAFEKMDPHNYD